jgi:very-short-patch-repair endonuclease
VSRSVPQRRLAVYARRQHGLFTLGQALQSGYSRSAVTHQLESGAWGVVESRVFQAMPAPSLTWRRGLAALTLATRGVASHRSAAGLHGMLPDGGRYEITVARSQRTRSNSHAHSTTSLPDCDVTIVDGIRATTPVRTLIDLGGTLALSAFEDALDGALVRELVRPERLAARAVELWAPRRSGCAVVLASLRQREAQVGDVRNLWEARVVRELRATALPEPSCNHAVWVGGRRRYIDFAWPSEKVALEFDGFEPHSRRRVFDDDRARQNDLVDEGWRVYRLTATSLTGNPKRAFGPIARALGVNW